MRVQWTNQMPDFDDANEDENPGCALHLITYANGRYRQIYIDVPQTEAMLRFETWMMKRSRFESMIEGWGATIESVLLIDGEGCIRDVRSDIQLLSELIAHSVKPDCQPT